MTNKQQSKNPSNQKRNVRVVVDGVGAMLEAMDFETASKARATQAMFVWNFYNSDLLYVYISINTN